jgi:hypothetical protein
VQVFTLGKAVGWLWTGLYLTLKRLITTEIVCFAFIGPGSFTQVNNLGKICHQCSFDCHQSSFEEHDKKNSRNANKKGVSIFSKRAQKPGTKTAEKLTHYHHTLSLWAPIFVKASVTNSDKVLVGPLKWFHLEPISNRTEKRGIISGALFWGVWWWCKVTGLSMWCFSRHWSYLWSIPNWV